MKVSNWGNYPVTEAEFRTISSLQDAMTEIKGHDHLIPRGLGRCYGDSALAPVILSTLNLDRFLDLDEENGVLACQAGLSLAEILKVIVPKGWFLPVTPGTKFVTVGGAIASDVHGKNHHADGSFSSHLLELQLMTASGKVMLCSKQVNASVFEATCGGMGLTGLVLSAKFKLKKVETAYIREESTKLRNVDELFKAFETGMKFTYSVAWVDCLAKGNSLGRSILLNGEHATLADLKGHKMESTPFELPRKLKLSVPFMLPSFTLNPLTIKAFNILFYGKAKAGTHAHVTDFETYFYPLDGVLHWNRVYGKKGFAQYQFVIPPEKGYDGMVKVLGEISKAKMPSFLSVLKYMGPQSGMLSFPMEGYTLAMDFPITSKLFPFLTRLDEIVQGFGGRIYLTKDSRMSAQMFQSGYPRSDEFKEIRKQLDPNGRFSSLQSNRLGLD